MAAAAAAAAAAGALPRVIGVYVNDGADVLASYHLLTVLSHTADPATPNRCFLVDLTDDGLLTTTLINDGHLSERTPVGSGEPTSFIRHWEKFLFSTSGWSATTEGAVALEQAKPLQRGASERGASALRHCYLMYGSSSEMRNILCGIGAASSMISENRRPPHGMRTFFEKLQTRHPTTLFVLALPSDLATTAGQYAARACSHLIVYRSLPVPVPMPLARWPDMRPTGYATTLTVDGDPQLRFALACDIGPWAVMSVVRQTLLDRCPMPVFLPYHRESGSGFYFLWASARNNDVLMPLHTLTAMTRCAASASQASAAAPTRAAFDEALALIRMPPPPPAASKQRASPSKVLPPKTSPKPSSPPPKRLRSSEATAVPDGGVEEETGVDNDDEGESSENLDDTAAVSAAGKVIVMLNGKPYSYTPSPLSSEQAERTSLDQMLRDWLLIEAGYESKSYGELAHRLLHILHLKERDVPDALKAAVASFVDGRKGRGYNSKKGDLVTLVNQYHINHHKEKAPE